MTTMIFLTVLRRELARAGLESLARVMAVDAAPTRARRSRKQHLRNGIGAILQASSQVAWRPTPLVSLLYLGRAKVQSDLRYGLDEFGQALFPPRYAHRRRALVLAAAPSVAGILAVAVRTRHKSRDGETDVGDVAHA
jgi:hypothetical protein